MLQHPAIARCRGGRRRPAAHSGLGLLLASARPPHLPGPRGPPPCAAAAAAARPSAARSALCGTVPSRAEQRGAARPDRHPAHSAGRTQSRGPGRAGPRCRPGRTAGPGAPCRPSPAPPYLGSGSVWLCSVALPAAARSPYGHWSALLVLGSGRAESPPHSGALSGSAPLAPLRPHHPPYPRWRRPSHGVSPPTFDGLRGCTKVGARGRHGANRGESPASRRRRGAGREGREAAARAHAAPALRLARAAWWAGTRWAGRGGAGRLRLLRRCCHLLRWAREGGSNTGKARRAWDAEREI